MVNLKWKTAILCDGKDIMSLEPPLKKTLLWHITNKCNQSCKYCYGSFTSKSYRETCNNKKDVPLKNLLGTVDDLSTLGFYRAHICGGEPFMRKDIWPFLLKLSENEIESFVLSNITFIPQKFEQHFKSGLFTNLSFSLDSINRKYNDWVRGNTNIVINNIKKIVQMKKRYGVSTELGLYGVITKINIGHLDELIDWAIDIGLNYISLQLVHLPKNHKYYRQFIVTSEYSEILMPVFEHLRSIKSHCRIPGNAFFEISNQFLLNRKTSVRNCFCERDINYLFIDGIGNIKCCPSKHNDSNHILGNISSKRLKEIKFPELNEEIICSEFSLDCLGVWEMAYPSTFEIRL